MKARPCNRDFEEAITLLATDSLDREQRAVVEKHISECAGCRKTYVQLRAICGALSTEAKNLPQGNLSPGFHARLSEVITKPNEDGGRRWDIPAIATGCVAIVFLLCQVTPYLLSPNTTDAPVGIADPPVAQSRALEHNAPPGAYIRGMSDEDFDAYLSRQASQILTPDEAPRSHAIGFGTVRSLVKTEPELL